jgi:hypothetical protein
MKFEIVAIMGDEKKKIIGGASNSCNFLNMFFRRNFSEYGSAAFNDVLFK